MGHRVLGIGLASTTLSDFEKALLRNTPPYGIVLFGRNVESVAQLEDLVGEIKRVASPAPLIMVDQEGGRVDRLRGLLPGLPSATAFEEGEEPERFAEWFGRVIGGLLDHFGIDLNLAPVVDIHHEGLSPSLERRCFGESGERVTELAGRFVESQEKAGVAGCLKHFPGMGLGNADPHYGAMMIEASLEELREEDLAPYRGLANRTGCVMVGHGIYPRIEESPVPATLSRRITTGLLRGELAFDGLAMTDDMEMHAVSDLGSFEEICDRALLAGNDVVLFCSHVERVPRLIDHMAARMARDQEMMERMTDALERAERFREHCAQLQREKSVRYATWQHLVDDAAAFCEELKKARRQELPPLVPAVDRRKRPRTPGTGKTGREEWT